MTSWQLRLSHWLLTPMRWMQRVYPIERPNALVRWRYFSEGMSQPGHVPKGFQKTVVPVGEAAVLHFSPPNLTPKPQRVIYFLHGSGFCFGWNSHFERMSLTMATLAGCPVYAADYRIAPEAPYPAAHEDSLAGYRWLLTQGIRPEEVILVGDSSGGHMALWLLLHLRDAGEPLPSGVAFLSAQLDLTVSDPYFWHNRDPFVYPQFPLKLANHYFGEANRHLFNISPLFADLHDLPPMLVMAGIRDILRRDAERLVERAHAANVAAQLELVPEAFHGWYLFPSYLPEAKQSLAAVADFVNHQETR